MDHFLTQFLLISNGTTIVFLIFFLLLLYLLYQMAKRNIDFSKRVFLATVLGLLFGLILQLSARFPKQPMDIVYIKEVTSWFALIGNGFIDLIRMLVIPLVIISIIHVLLHMEEAIQVGRLVKHTLMTTLGMVALSAIVGLSLGLLFQLGGAYTYEASEALKEVTPLTTTLQRLIPANPVEAMVSSNIVGLVIFSAFTAIAAKAVHKKHADVIQPFYRGIDALHKIIIQMSLTIMKGMPYAVLALLANTIAQRGLSSILEVLKFILVLYLACLIMFALQLVLLLVHRVNPIPYLKKCFSLMLLAFTSRSSVGVLPSTIETLTSQLGVSEGTASFVASFGTTAGMQGCAGLFPSLLIIYVANTAGIPIDFGFFIMALLVVSIGSIGIAGIPGTATVAASVGLSGIGLGGYFSFITPILAVDPIIDMPRTMINVTGSLTNAIAVDRQLQLMHMSTYLSEAQRT